MIWYAVFRSDAEVTILANKKTVAHKILVSVKRAYTHLPQWMQQGVVNWNKDGISLEDGSRIVTETGILHATSLIFTSIPNHSKIRA